MRKHAIRIKNRTEKGRISDAIIKDIEFHHAKLFRFESLEFIVKGSRFDMQFIFTQQ